MEYGELMIYEVEGLVSTQLRSFLAYQRMIEGQSEKALEIALVI